MTIVNQHIRQKHRGATAELEAAVWLLGQGYEVFRNVSPHGEIDLVAIKGTETLRIDVKTRDQFYRKPEQPGVTLLFRVTGGFVWNHELPLPEIGSCQECGTPPNPTDRRAKKFCSAKCRGTHYARSTPGQRSDPRTVRHFVSTDPEDRALRGL